MDEPSNATSPRWLARAAFFALWALSIARERRARLRRARRARDLGMIVLSDRFPQSQQAGFNDYYYGCLKTGARNLCRLPSAA